MPVLERARRLVGGKWTYQTVDESGGGGSQPYTVVGPYPVLFSDIPDNDDTLELFTPDAGQIITDIFVRIVTPFNVGEGTAPVALYDGSPDTGNSYGPNTDLSQTPSNSVNGAESLASLAGQDGSFAQQLPAYMGAATPDPVTLLARWAAGGGGPATVGESEFFFAVATLVAP